MRSLLGPRGTQSSVVQAWEWRESVCVGVCQSTHCDHYALAFLPTQTGTYTPTGIVDLRLHQPTGVHAWALIANAFVSFLKFYTHTHTCVRPHAVAHTHTGFLFSQLCSNIKQSLLRGNEPADGERLVGHRGRRHTQTSAHTQKRAHRFRSDVK